MKNKFIRICGVLLAGLAAPMVLGADSAPATQPSPRVEIFAFTSISKPDQGDWTGRGIQENLQSDVSHTGATLILPHVNTPTGDVIADAKLNHADLAVIGTYQVVGDQIRVNGNVVNVATDASVGGFSATGLQSDLFKVEDALGEQLRHLLPRPMTADQLYQVPAQPAPVTVYQQPVQNYYSLPPTVSTYDDSGPATVYVAPDYGDDYFPGFYGGFGYSGGYYNNFAGRNRGYEHHDSNRGYSGRSSFGISPSYHGSVSHGGGSFLGSSHGGFGGFHGGGGGGGGGRR